MAGYRTVKQGDHLSSIAKEAGFSDYRTIWNHPNNADLKGRRRNPNVLYPGDQIFVPDRETREESCATDRKHKFLVRAPTLMLRLVLEDELGQAVANTPCDLTLGSRDLRVTTDRAGRFEVPISPDVRHALLIIRDSNTPHSNDPIPIQIGHLDPADTTSGQIGRLNNLGYRAGALDAPDAKALKSAIEEFQCDHFLAVDGVCGPNTQAKLKEVHGS